MKLAYSPSHYILLTMVFLSACNRKIKTPDSGFENAYFIIENVPDCKEKRLQGIDSVVGEITCGDVKLSYDYGAYSDEGPITALSQFRHAFHNYYYSQFFEKVHIDPKLNRIFRDSVTVIRVVPASEINKSALIKTCEGCDAVAELEFKSGIFYFPFVLDPMVKTTRNDFIIDEIMTDSFYYKIYWNENRESSGFYAELLKGPSAEKYKLSVMVTEGKKEQSMPILKQIRMK